MSTQANLKIKLTKTNITIQHLKRLIAADSWLHDDKLRSLDENPDQLRKELRHLIDADSISFLKSNDEDDSDVMSYLDRRKIPKERIVFLFDQDSQGDGWGGDCDTLITDKDTYIVITIENDRVIERAVCKESTFILMGRGQDEKNIQMLDPQEDYKPHTLYELILLHPKILERLLLMYGHETILRLLH